MGAKATHLGSGASLDYTANPFCFTKKDTSESAWSWTRKLADFALEDLGSVLGSPVCDSFCPGETEAHREGRCLPPSLERG